MATRMKKKGWPLVAKEIKKDGTERWRVDARVRINGKTTGQRRWYATEAEANEAARQARIARENDGIHVFSLDRKQMAEFERAAEILEPFGAKLGDAAAFYARHLHEQKTIIQKPVTEVVEEFLEEPGRRAKGGNSKRYQEDLRSRLYRFWEDFGTKPIREVTTRELDEWLADLVVTRNGKHFGEPVSPQTRMNYRRLLIVLFNYAVRNGYCERNPVDLTVRPRLPETEIGILTPEQTEALLEVTEGDIRAFLAIGAFAGLRRSEIERLEWNEVDLEGRLIEVAAKKAKTASRRFVRLSENLIEWLDPMVKRSGMVCPSKEMLRKRLLIAREDARITEWPNNALRHSYASYHLAKHRDAPALALELGHTTTNLIFRHYRRLVRPEDAEKYWEIVP